MAKKDDDRLRYLGECAKCGIAMYQEHGRILTAGKSSCEHVLKVAAADKMIQRVFYLRIEDDLFITRRAKKNKCSRGEYLRALIEADRNIVEKEEKT